MTKELDDAVTQGVGWDFACPRPEGCGANGVPFTSTGWDTKKAATERGRQHLAEHDGGEPMQGLDEFRASQAEGNN